MANEIRHSTLQTSGGQVASVLSPMLRSQLFDPVDLRAAMPFVDVDGLFGSDSVEITKDAVPGAATAATSEIDGSNITNSAYTTGRFTLQWARYGRKYQSTDLLQINGGPVQLQQIVDNLRMTIGLTITDLLTALFPALANSVGSTGVDLSVDDMYDAQFQLNSQSVPGPYFAVLHPTQVNDLISSLRGENGSVLTQEGLNVNLAPLKDPGFKGFWNGSVAVWQSDSVTLVNTSADRSGAMFGFGCWEYTLRDWKRLAGGMINPADVIDVGVAFIERIRDGGNAMTSQMLNMYPAVVEREDLRGVEIITDA
jgi:hypothetical protein